MKIFIVNSKDLLDKDKNPYLSLSVGDILDNTKIKKKTLKGGTTQNGKK